MKKVLIIVCFSLFHLFTAKSQDTIFLSTYAGNLKKIKVVIADSVYSFLFDTGGGETFISPAIAETLQRNVYGKSTGVRMNGELISYKRYDSIDLKIGHTKIFHPSIAVWDLMSILPKELPVLHGVISLKSFHDKIISVDLFKNLLIIETTKSCQKKLKQMTLLESRFANGLDGNDLNIFLNIPYGSKSYWFLFDCGNLDNLLLSKSTAVDWRFQTDTSLIDKEPKELQFKIGSRNFIEKARIANIIYDGALNYATLSKAIFIINFPKKEVWIN